MPVARTAAKNCALFGKFGSKGVSYLMQGQMCLPEEAGNECNPAFTGKSWVRLTAMTDATHIKVSSPIDWQNGDTIVVTPTDYLPSHTEEVQVQSVDADQMTITLQAPGLKQNHNASTFSFSAMPDSDGPQDDPNKPDIHRAVDTRFAVTHLPSGMRLTQFPNLRIARWFCEQIYDLTNWPVIGGTGTTDPDLSLQEHRAALRITSARPALI